MTDFGSVGCRFESCRGHNYFLKIRTSNYHLMSITGHKTESQFLNYIQQNKEEAFESFAQSVKERDEKF